MAYTHGVYVNETPTSIVPPIQVDSAVQVAVGIAPVNLGSAEDPLAPQIAYSYNEAVKKLGISPDGKTYMLSQVIRASFTVYAVAPVVLINVLDPKTHTKALTSVSVPIIEKVALLAQEGVLADSVAVKSEDGSKSYVRDTDYSLSFDKLGQLVISILDGGAITPADASLKISGKQLDPTKVTKVDIIAGIEKLREVYPRFSIVSGTLLAPGWSNDPEVYMAMTAKTMSLNGKYRYTVLADLDTQQASAYDKANEVKNSDGITNIQSIALWPMCRVGAEVYHFSALAGAHIAYVDYLNNGVPYVSPSNKELKISGICDYAGAEIVLDEEQANQLNGQGICTAINADGWKFWGNRTAGYPSATDPKDTFIPVRRMFNWWANTFILTYRQKVDDPMNKRLIEAVVDSENIRANGFKSQLQIADARIEYRVEDNPETDQQNGTIKFKQYLTPFPPSETIINDLEFSAEALSKALSK